MIVGEKVDFLKNKYLGKTKIEVPCWKKKTLNSAFYRATSDLQTGIQHAGNNFSQVKYEGTFCLKNFRLPVISLINCLFDNYQYKFKKPFLEKEMFICC